MPEFTWPDVAPLSRGYGLQKDGSFHPGIDIAVPVGTAVKASAIGTVSQAAADSVGGKTIVIQDPGGYETVYADLQDVNVKVGDTVSQGQVIALSGGASNDNSGAPSTGPHLHFQIDKGKGEVHNVDPTLLLNTPTPSAAPTPTATPYQNKDSILTQIKKSIILGPLGAILTSNGGNNPVTDAIPGSGAVKTTVSTAVATGKIANFLIDPANWKRIGLFALGAAIVIFTVVKLGSDTDTGKIIKGAAEKAALA